MHIKAVIFDIGGVVVGSPVAAIGRAEQQWSLPPHWLNAAITARGEDGAFQRLERGELGIEDFYRRFGEELSEVGRGNEAYQAYCRKAGIGSKRYKVAALTNNFAPLGHKPTRHRPSLDAFKPVSTAELRASLKAAAAAPDSIGSGNDMLRSMFDEYIESCVEGLRKPAAKFFQLALDRIGVKAEEAVFLDDIGHNLIVARKMGMHTIRVHHGRSKEAIQELERVLGMSLLQGSSKL
ncbi:SPOSA6832_01883 [Sporobolomyces salmonicolor]|uniref:SPOSA6832_01883-mRNA-1:cds n=1 Tax=Sporidiobolus salmonicolor TaxID=5005 RepID=A0A0D6EJZ0_SPOSA|nr:SPOSA6832_01883 [Sporobolomyces salmonicolor]